NELERAHFQLQKAEHEGNYEAASKLKYGDIPALEQQIRELDVSWKLERPNVAEVVSRSTGVPVERILRSQQQNILDLEPHLKENIVGQEKALTEIAETLIASHAGLSNQNRPMGAFLLMGPSGVGKTETAKGLARYLFSSDRHMLKFDLSEFSEQHSVAKLIGAPPGYVGYEKGGVLTEAVRRSPYSVILFDEAEKAHDDFTDILLQILDEGRLTDSQGRTVNFKNTIVFITSNLKDHTAYFKPEVIGRLDAVLYYAPLNEEAMDTLIGRELFELNEKLSDKEIDVTLSQKFREKIRAMGFDDRYGARPLKTAFNRLVIRPVSKLILGKPDLKGTLAGHVDDEGKSIFR
ncbi:MAG: AAA family ATPase, partial [Nitrospinota bacterium]